MSNNIPYLEQPCERCGSKKLLSKVRKATLQNLSSVSKIEYSLITCKNAICQKEFEANLEDKRIKAEEVRIKREEAKAASATKTH